MGLAIRRSIINRHDGELRVENELWTENKEDGAPLSHSHCLQPGRICRRLRSGGDPANPLRHEHAIDFSSMSDEDLAELLHGGGQSIAI
jgi:hypothetical protein